MSIALLEITCQDVVEHWYDVGRHHFSQQHLGRPALDTACQPIKENFYLSRKLINEVKQKWVKKRENSKYKRLLTVKIITGLWQNGQC